MNVNQLIIEFLRDNKMYLVGYIIFMLAYPITSVLLPKYYGQIVDELKNDKPLSFKIVVFLLIGVNIMYLVLDRLDNVFIPKLQSYVKTNIVQVILQNYKDKFEEQELGKLISKIVKLPIIIRDLVRQIHNYIVPMSLILLFIPIRYFMIDRSLGIMVLTSMIVSFIVLIPITKDCLELSSTMEKDNENSNEHISELFDNLLDIYSMDTYDEEIKNLEKQQQESISVYKKTFNCTNKLRGIMNAFALATFLGSFVYAYQLYRQNKINLGNMISTAVTSMYIIGKIGSLSGEAPDLIFNIGAYHRISKYLYSMDNLKPVKKEKYQVKHGEITFKDVGIKYGNKKVINNFNLNIKPKDSVVIIGKIGSGKSSLIKALLKLTPYTGNIYLDGQDISELDPSAVRSQILFVRQNPIPFNRTLYENIVYGNKHVTKNHVINLFDKYNLTSFFNHNLDDKVGRKGDKLSGGQRQMIFLLRILLSKKPIIILDEPTSSLDSESANYVLKILKDILNTRTVILITHDDKIGQTMNNKITIT